MRVSPFRTGCGIAETHHVDAYPPMENKFYAATAPIPLHNMRKIQTALGNNGTGTQGTTILLFLSI
jgi:hypothetical protein